jgi:transposase
MVTAVAELPDDVDALKAMILAMAEQAARLEVRNNHLEAHSTHLELVNNAADERS